MDHPRLGGQYKRRHAEIKKILSEAAQCVNRCPSRGQRKNIKFSRPAAIRCWPLFSVPGMGSISARCTGRGLICGEGEGFVFGCVPPEEDDRTAWAILLRKNGFSPGFVKFLPKFKKVLASYTDVRCMILSRKKRSNAEGLLTGSGDRSGDISCRKKDVSCRRPRKARKICYTERRKLKNCPGAPPDP